MTLRYKYKQKMTNMGRNKCSFSQIWPIILYSISHHPVAVELPILPLVDFSLLLLELVCVRPVENVTFVIFLIIQSFAATPKIYLQHMMCILLALPILVTIIPNICCNISSPSLMGWFTPRYTFWSLKVSFSLFHCIRITNF